MPRDRLVEAGGYWLGPLDAIDRGDPREGQRLVELVGLAGARREGTQAVDEPPLGLRPPVVGEVGPGEAQVIAMVKRLGLEGASFECRGQFVLVHTTYDTTKSYIIETVRPEPPGVPSGGRRAPHVRRETDQRRGEAGASACMPRGSPGL